MFTTNKPGALTLALITALAACEDNGTAPLDANLPLDLLAETLLETDDLLGSVINTQAQNLAPTLDVAGPSQDLIVTDASFTRTRTCPAGGSVLIEGTGHREYDTESRVMEADWEGSRTKTDCGHVRGELTVTVNGAAEWSASRRRVDGAFDGLQVSTHEGSFLAVRSDGAERSCEFDVEVVRDPDAGTKTITGTICGEEVNKTKDWDPGP